MKISQLLATHRAILERARLANLAEAYATLRVFAERARRAQLRGFVNVRQPDAAEERNWAELNALDGRQGPLEEHFTDEDVLEFADAMAHVCGTGRLDLVFRIESLGSDWVAPLERVLRASGVEIDVDTGALERRGRPAGAPADAARRFGRRSHGA